MKFKVAELRLVVLGALWANEKDWKAFSNLLHKRQPHFCSIVDEVGSDPRCYGAYRFCVLFCGFALEQAEIRTNEVLPPFTRYEIEDMASMVAQGREEYVGKRAIAFPSRVRRHVLSHVDFDEVDTQWLCTTISAFLVLMEKSLSGRD
jgi:hypothetical protein